MVERFQRPALLIAVTGEWGRGSGRSVAGLDLTEVLGGCADLLEAYGGHAYAAGLTIARERLPELRRRVEAEVRGRLAATAFTPRLTLDADLGLAECDLGLVEWIERLTPYGNENGEPLFRAAEVGVDSVTRVGDGRHLKFRAHDARGSAEAIGFGLGEQADALAAAGRCGLAFVPQRNVWQGRSRVQLKVKGLKLE
jgi:single-stranded-DNA-specific exonuclease